MLDRAIRVVSDHVQQEALNVADEAMQSRNPPRSSRDHRHFIDSWFWTDGGRKTGSKPDARPGKAIGRGNDAPHALILDLGLGTTKTGRRIGTRAAPRGYSKPALLATRAAKERIIREGIARANRRL
jgi:hypothetical protein